jgi:transposase
VVEDVDFDDAAQAVVVSVRPNAKARGRCGRCARRLPRYDRGEGRRRWRALDVGTTKVFLEADAPRVQCRTHGPTVAAVPWARHDAGHTRDFDDMAAWLAVRTSKSAVCQLLRIAWRTVGSIVTWGSTPRSTPSWTASMGCAGSGSTRSPTSAGTAT